MCLYLFLGDSLVVDDLWPLHVQMVSSACLCLQPVRGKKTKAAKAKAKYADQDEEDRELAMQFLGSAGKLTALMLCSVPTSPAIMWSSSGTHAHSLMPTASSKSYLHAQKSTECCCVLCCTEAYSAFLCCHCGFAVSMPSSTQLHEHDTKVT